ANFAVKVHSVPGGTGSHCEFESHRAGGTVNASPEVANFDAKSRQV
ncbi:hypothetical protein pipiens_000854, partial [Culex pipiens pipiens]